MEIVMKKQRLERFPLGNPRFNWRQRELVLSTFNGIGLDTIKDKNVFAVESKMRLCRDCGFNMAEMGWADSEKAWRAAAVCDEVGLDLVFQDLSLMGGMMYRLWDRNVTDETIRATARKLKDKKHIIGFYVWDEPYDETLFNEARRQSDILHSECPNALLFTVFPPSYNSGSSVKDGAFIPAFERYIETVSPPVISLDHYPVGDYFKLSEGFVYDEENQLDNALIWYDLAILRQMSRKYGYPFWFYYQGIPIFECVKKLEFPKVRCMAYAALLYGAKGLQHYSAGGAVFTQDGKKGPHFEQLKIMNANMRSLGNTLMALESRAVYHSEELRPGWIYGELYDGVKDDINDSAYFSPELPFRTSVSEMSDGYGNDYIMVLNREFYGEREITLKFKSDVDVYEVSKTDGDMRLSYMSVKSLTLTLDGGDAALYRIAPAGSEASVIEYYIN
ncbi:MAG: hypothetical protein IJV70_02375 [Clostridia bacterium]|nr:hypothetical protein [Clostridia bacterium]